MNGQMVKQDYSQDSEMARYWIKEGPKTAAFLLVIPGCTAIGYGFGLLQQNVMPYSIIGLGMGALIWGLVVVLRRT